MMNNPLGDVIRNLPELPGVYQFYDASGTIIYVGKAKNLKKRVSSYFNKNHGENKTAILVRKINSINHIVVNSEQDALLLENNLIKSYKPRYNVMLKDDKTFPWIAISNEPFPRIFTTRTYVKDGTEYFGPYSNVKSVRVILDLIQHLFKTRTCKLPLSTKSIQEKKFKLCLQYHIGNCLGPCLGYQDEREYLNSISEARKIIQGNIDDVIKYMKKRMLEEASQYNFETAQALKVKLEMLEKFQAKSAVVSSTINNVDVFSIYETPTAGYVNYLRIINGAITQVHSIELKRRLDEPKEELLELAITELRSRMMSSSKEIILPIKIDYPLDNVKITVPSKGEKKLLLDLSYRNAKFFAMEKKVLKSENPPVNREQRILDKLQEDLRLKSRPIHIECFDNSNIQGTNPVASCVVFFNGKPARKEYRHFNIKTVEGPNDFASMSEIVHRRYSRLLNEQKSLPQLIVIDGGKGQLSAALDSLKALKINDKIAVVGIAKRLEEIYFPEDPYPLYIKKDSESLKLIQFLRNEAHRFAITFHRTKRSAGFIQSELLDIAGIGQKTMEILLKNFNSVQGIRAAEKEELVKIVGSSKTTLILNHFQSDI